MKKLTAIALSGGVDSTAAALLLKDQGEKIIGITMQLVSKTETRLPKAGCYSSDEPNRIKETKTIAEKIGIDLKVIDCSTPFKEHVLTYVKNSYLSGETPNPCVVCNTYVKFGAFLNDLPYEKIATGHYVRKADGLLRRAKENRKDQSYFLYRLTPEILKRIDFPLGDWKKEDTKKFVHIKGFAVAEKKESQDFMDKDFSSLLGKTMPGKVLDTSGKTIGTHDGYFNYTIGQRKGAFGGGAKEPLYVKEINAKTNEIIMAPITEMMTDTLMIRDEIFHDTLPEKAFVKFRSTQKEMPCHYDLKNKTIHLMEKTTLIAKGQSAVFYTAEGIVLGGGIVI